MASTEPEQVVEGAPSATPGTNDDMEIGKSPSGIAKNYSNIDSSVRALKSLRVGDSEVEELAERIESRRANRIPIVPRVRFDFLKTCREIAELQNCEPKSKIPLTNLIALRDEVKEEVDQRSGSRKTFRECLSLVGFQDVNVTMLELLNRGIDQCNKLDEEWFYYQDFNFFHTKLISRWPWMRNASVVAAVGIFFFYLFTPIWFCHIAVDRDVCKIDPTGQNRSYYGWLTSLYFASTTMSTVGYGDITVRKDKAGFVFVGVLYMIIALLVAISAFSAAADNAFAPLSDLNEKIVNFFIGPFLHGKELHKKISRVKAVKLTEVFLQFMFLNIFGMFICRFFVGERFGSLETPWTWMETFYWAIQTTTTIGYGDLDMPFDLQWFQIFFLALGTYFVGSALGKLASLKDEILSIRRLYAWERRVVSKGMIEDMQAYEHDDKVDQYEYVVSSLLSLGKISSDDIAPIMNKFRALSGDKGYISLADAATNEEEESLGDGGGNDD